jgi:predicted dehydrogenase
MVKPWNQLAVLIAGCGSVGKRHARVLHSLGVSDLRACDVIAGQGQSLAAPAPGVRLHPSYSAGLSDQPDAVFICTPPEKHIPVAVEAIRAGCHVFSEKPLSDTAQGVDERVALAESRRTCARCGLCMEHIVISISRPPTWPRF